MDPILGTALVSLGLIGCGFYWGFTHRQSNIDALVQHAIGTTIDNLIRDGFLYMEENEDGEQIIRRVDDVVKQAVDEATKV